MQETTPQLTAAFILALGAWFDVYFYSFIPDPVFVRGYEVFKVNASHDIKGHRQDTITEVQ